MCHYMVEAETLGSVSNATSIDKTQLAWLVRRERFITAEMFLHMGSGHLGTIVKVGTNTIEIVMFDFINGIFLRRGVGCKQLGERRDGSINIGESSSIKKGCKARTRGKLAGSSFACVAGEVENIFITNAEGVVRCSGEVIKEQVILGEDIGWVTRNSIDAKCVDESSVIGVGTDDGRCIRYGRRTR